MFFSCLEAMLDEKVNVLLSLSLSLSLSLHIYIYIYIYIYMYIYVYIYILYLILQNQFFISVMNNNAVKNQLADAIYDRIVKAHEYVTVAKHLAGWLPFPAVLLVVVTLELFEGLSFTE